MCACVCVRARVCVCVCLCMCYLVINIILKDDSVIFFIIVLITIIFFSNNTVSLFETFMTISGTNGILPHRTKRGITLDLLKQKPRELL